MKQLFPRGKRIRPTDKDLVSHTALAALVPVFLLVVLLFHTGQIAGTNWQEVSLSQIIQDVNIPYLLFSMGVAGVVVEKNGGWRYSYGNMFYALLVSQYLTVAQFDDETVQAIMEEALKYEGWTYVYGGDSPSTSFDCSGLVQWCYGKAGIALPRTAQEQYNVTQHIPLSEAKAGDLVFFHSTYNAGTYITHVGLYVGNNRMYHAGNPIGYADLTGSYWQQHLAGAGRIKQ